MATTADLARFNSISTNGATVWMNASKIAIRFTSMQFHVAKALYLGSPLRSRNKCCLKCGTELGAHGERHALHCEHGNERIMRHNRIRDVVATLFRRAGYETSIEQKLNRHSIDPRYPYDNDVHGVPGDCKTENYFDCEGENAAWLDVVVGNVFAASYIKDAAKKRLYVAHEHEKRKQSKYNHHPNVIPLAIESMGGIGTQFRRVLGTLADAVSVRTNTPYPVVMERVRMKVVSTLMQCNCEMIMSSMLL